MSSITTATGADLSRTHLVGAGGAGMSAIGMILLDRGVDVSGSDAKASRALTGLGARGARTAVGQRAENLDLLPGGPTAVVVSTAIRPDNPEVVEAERRGLPVVRRADALAALMVGYRGVCVAGTHGKTSTTSMLTVALQTAGVDPSFAIGGELNESGTGAHAGSGDVFVAEADESDGSFLAFSPQGAIITTVEPDHLDHHGTPAAYTAVFEEFVRRVDPEGFLVVGTDDVGVRALVESFRRDAGARLPQVISYGRDADADLRIRSITPNGSGSRAEIAVRTAGYDDVLALDLAVPGEHMVANAVAALAAGLHLGIPADAMLAGLAAYTGVRRRFDFRGQVGSIRVYDDYAHHPTEVAATISAARSVAGDGRVVVVFQPHLYSRTQTFAREFGRALGAADVAVVLDVFGAREDPMPGISGEIIADAVPPATAAVFYVPSMAAAPDAVARIARDHDVILTMGAGDVTMLGPEILDRLDVTAAGHGGRATGADTGADRGADRGAGAGGEPVGDTGGYAGVDRGGDG